MERAERGVTCKQLEHCDPRYKERFWSDAEIEVLFPDEEGSLANRLLRRAQAAEELVDLLADEVELLRSQLETERGHHEADNREWREEVEPLREKLDRLSGLRRDCQVCGRRTPFSGALFCSERCVIKAASAAGGE